MRSLVVLAVVGLLAQLVDGSLGMAYGVTSTTLMLGVGVAPAAASATVHLAEIGTTLASGVAHSRFGNVDWRVVRHIGVPGAIGAFAGATVLSGLSTVAAVPLTATVLFALGLYVVSRFTFFPPSPEAAGRGRSSRPQFLVPLGLFGGFLDATGGGGWGPVGTPALLAHGDIEPRKVIGSIDASEFLVALAASAGFFVALHEQVIVPGMALALFVGGLVAAPLAAWIVRLLPPQVLGSAVGGVIVLTNARTLLGVHGLDVADPVRACVLGIVGLGWAAAVAVAVRRHRRSTTAGRARLAVGSA